MPGDVKIMVVSGPGTGRLLEVPIGGRGLIGRAADLVIPLDSISREHVRVENRPDGVWLKNIGKNAVVLGGRKLPKGAEAHVPFESTLELGETRLEIRFDTPLEPPRGLKLGRWLAGSQSGNVYAGEVEGLSEPVAIKVVQTADRAERARLDREVGLLKKFDHPGIVRFHALLEHGGRLFFVSELVEGRSLEDELAKGALSWPRAAQIGATVASALAHAHDKSVVHRDVTPANILLAASGAAKLVDFGFARIQGQEQTLDGTRLTRTSDTFGTFHYVAPEQINSARDATTAADVYGLAAVLYHALTGSKPFADVRHDDFIRVVFKGAPPLAHVAPSVPPRLAAVVTRAMNPILELRPDAGTLAAELAKAAAP